MTSQHEATNVAAQGAPLQCGLLSSATPPSHGFTQVTVHEQQEAEHYARLYKAHNPRLRFRLPSVDDDGDPVNDSEPIEV